MTAHHPIRDMQIWTFIGLHGGIAFFEDGKAFPVYARGRTAGEATEKLEAIRAEIIEKHEASVVKRMEAKAAREAEKAKKPAVAA